MGLGVWMMNLHGVLHADRLYSSHHFFIIFYFMASSSYSLQTLGDFVSHLLEKKSLTNVDPTVFAELKKDLEDRLEQRINAALVAALPPEKLEEFDDLLETADTGAIQRYCQEHIPNIDQVVADELIRFEMSYLNA